MNENTQVQAQNQPAETTKKLTLKDVLVGIGVFAAGVTAGVVGMHLYESHKDTSEPSSTDAFV